MTTTAEDRERLFAQAKAAGVPLYQWLGGPTRTRARTVRVVGPDQAASLSGDFAVRCPATLNQRATAALVRRIEKNPPLWISHPSPAVIRALAGATIPLAAASEHLELMRDESADLLLLDLPQLGLRRSLQLAAMAEAHYMAVVLANCTTPEWREAAIHLALALPNFFAIEVGSEESGPGYWEVRG
jgi:L-alanine-DL-glutamate epimerase-like enolase superfamily enzyme